MKKGTKILIGITLIAILLGLKPMTAKAAAVEYNYKKFRIQYYSLATGTSAWSGINDFGTRIALSNGYGVSATSIRFGWNSKFQAGTKYRVVIEVGFAPNTYAQEFIGADRYTCFGSTSTSNWNADDSLIQECSLIGSQMTQNDRHIKYIFDITPLSTIIGIQFNIYYATTQEITGVNVYTTSGITYGEDITGAIDNQTIIIQNSIEDLKDILEDTYEYETEDITENVEDLHDQQEEIQQNLNTDTTGKLGFFWDVNGLSTIWTYINKIRTITMVATIMNAFMALGIIKLILGR